MSVLPSGTPRRKIGSYFIHWTRAAFLCVATSTLLASSYTATAKESAIVDSEPEGKIRGVIQISNVDYHLNERSKNRAVDGQRQISLRFDGSNKTKPWHLHYIYQAYVKGVKGNNARIKTWDRFEGDVTNAAVGSLWSKFSELGIAMPAASDNPTTETGKKWDWSIYTDAKGKRIVAYGKLSACAIFSPLTIEYDGAECKLAVERYSDLWRKITNLFLEFSNSERKDPSFRRECTTLETQGDDQPCVATTLEALLAHPGDFHGKRVRVSGYHHAEFEGDTFSSGPDSIDDYKKSLWFGGLSEYANNSVKIIDGNITVEGTFMEGPGGHMGLWPGELQRITKIERQKPAGQVKKAH